MKIDLFCNMTFKSNVFGIFTRIYNTHKILVEVSGSSKQSMNGTIQMTKPEYAVLPYDKGYDWCSNCGKSYDELPWIMFSVEHYKFKINGYFFRCGCCRYTCYCDEISFCPYGCMYSWSLEASDDKVIWTEIHNIPNHRGMELCSEMTYNFDQYFTARYLRIIQKKNCPGWLPCFVLNRVEFFGDVIPLGDDDFDVFMPGHEESDVSIIGRFPKFKLT